MLDRVGIRAAVQAYLTGNVPNLTTVYTGEPRHIPENAYFTLPTKSGSVAFPYIEDQYDERIAFTGGPFAQPVGAQGKLVKYTVALSVRFFSVQPKGEVALDDHDTILSGILTRLRADRTLGTSNNPAGQVLFQVGEGDTVNGRDLYVVSGPGPRQRKISGPIVIWSMVRFMVIEAI